MFYKVRFEVPHCNTFLILTLPPKWELFSTSQKNKNPIERNPFKDFGYPASKLEAIRKVLCIKAFSIVLLFLRAIFGVVLTREFNF